MKNSRNETISFKLTNQNNVSATYSLKVIFSCESWNSTLLNKSGSETKVKRPIVLEFSSINRLGEAMITFLEAV